MFKKLLLLCTLLISSSLTQAGPYLGAALGIQNTGGGYTGLLVSPFLGFGLPLCQTYYIGGELFADSGSIPLSQNYYHRTNYGIGASITPGFILSQNTIIYLRAGVETFRYSTTLNFFTGGQLGLGLQTMIAEQWDVRGEYVYTGKGIIRNFGTPRFNFFKVGLVYKIK